MTNLGGWLSAKYAVLGEHADAAERQASAALGHAAAAGISANAGATLANTQASQIPADSTSRRALEAAQAGYLGVQGQNIQANDIDPITEGEAFQAQRSLNPLMLGGPPHSTTPSAAPYRSAPSTLDSTLAIPGFAAGTPKVPGKGDGTVDKVPAMLAPGEAVLNAGAAEHFGRHNIAALNAVGQAKMQAGKGAPPPAKAAPVKGQHFKGGTHNVQPGKSAKTPKIDPNVIQALMSMGSGGAGPAPMGGAPMTPPAPGMVPPGR